MLRTLDQHQSREQAGFRSGFSTINHIQVISQLQENADEYNIPDRIGGGTMVVESCNHYATDRVVTRYGIV